MSARRIMPFHLTDHDAVKGCLEIREFLRPGDPVFLTGVEFSCRDALGKYHILGCGYDPEAASIRELVSLDHGFRIKKLSARPRFLRETAKTQ